MSKFKLKTVIHIIGALFVITLLLSLSSNGNLYAQGLGNSDFGTSYNPDETDDVNELIVLLNAGTDTPKPDEVVAAANQKLMLPANLGVGAPTHVKYLISDRAKGATASALEANPETAAAKLQRYVVITYPENANIDAIMKALQKNPHVLHVSKNRKAGLSITPSDTHYINNNQWGIDKLNLPYAWDLAKGHAYVAVTDTGIETTHPDLQAFDGSGNYVGGNFRPNLSHDYGYNDPNVDPSQEDPYGFFSISGHGTHVAGTIAATTDNTQGVAGTCWNCSLIISKCCTLGGGSNQNIVVDAINGSIERGAQIINMSLGLRPITDCGDSNLAPDCITDPDDSLCQAIKHAEDRDVLIVAASGNDGSAFPDFPANDSRVIGVAGIMQSGELWDLNAQGCPSCNCWSSNIAYYLFNAPASDVWSTLHHTFGGFFYGTYSGTSMATPHIAGITGILRSVNPLLSKSSIKDILAMNLEPMSYFLYGLGWPDAEAAVITALGITNGYVLENRLTPLFTVYNRGTDKHFSTTAPQMASSYLIWNAVEYNISLATSIQPVPGYDEYPHEEFFYNPSPHMYAWAWVYIFTTDKKPAGLGDELVPLYRMRAKTTDLQEQHFFYATDEADLNWANAWYDLEGIEGYIYSCTGPIPPGAERLYRLYNYYLKDFVIVPESKVQDFLDFPDPINGYEYVSDIVPSLADYIGYVYPNADYDGDNLIDGFENLIGTNYAVEDSDSDGLTDGKEILQYPYSDPLSADHVCGCNDVLLDADNSVDEGETLECSAKHSITLLPGFHAARGSTFHAYIDN